MRAAWTAAATGLMVAVLTGCPHEADDGRAVRFTVKLAYTGTFPREPDAQVLTVGRADVEALGVVDPTVRAEFGSFTVRTTTEAEGDARFEHCLADPIVITDADTGAAVRTIPPGTCLTERTPLEID